MKIFLPIALAITTLVTLPAAGAAQTALTGPWTLTLNSPEGTNTVPLTLATEGEAVTATIRLGAGGAGDEAPVLFSGTQTGSRVRFFWELDYNGMALQITMEGEDRGGEYGGVADFSGLAQGDWVLRRGS